MVIDFKNYVGGNKVYILKNKIKEKYNLTDEVIDEVIADAMLEQYSEGYIDYKRLYKDVLEKLRLKLIDSKCKIIPLYKETPIRVLQDEPYERIIKRAFNKLYDREQGILLEYIIKEDSDEIDIDEYNLVVQKLALSISESDEELGNLVLKKLTLNINKKRRK